MGGRAGGGAGGGMGARAAAREFKARTSQARTPFEKGSAGYKEARFQHGYKSKKCMMLPHGVIPTKDSWE